MINGAAPLVLPPLRQLVTTFVHFCKSHALPLAACLALCAFATSVALAKDPEKPSEKSIDFDRQIRPLLSDNCFSCHGPDAGHREAELRLDSRDAATGSGAIDAEQLASSELLKRIVSTDPETMMPPPKSNKQLSPAQKELIQQWVEQGAVYARHWAFEPPHKPTIPAGQSAIDYLVGEKLKSEGLDFSPPADPATLARRLALDLVGLPPQGDDVASMVAANTVENRQAYIDQLLASPHYGERMAISWLDVVRFADTIGYHSDTPRNIYPYRDYVIAAFNSNKPFDQFTVEQVAGDLLPDATQEQLVASGFNRLLLTTEEGGSQAKDYEARYLGDRVRAIGTAWLGLTIGCSQCHDHKFDPITMRDFYSMGAFFADIDEVIIGKREEGIAVPSASQAKELQKRKVQVAQLKSEFEADYAHLADAQSKWEGEKLSLASAAENWQSLLPREATSEAGAKLTIASDKSVLASDAHPDKDTYKLALAVAEPTEQALGLRLEAIPHASLPAGGSGRAANGNFVLTEVAAQLRHADGTLDKLKFTAAKASQEQTVAPGKHPDKRWSAASTIDGDKKGAQWGWAILPDVTKTQKLQLAFAKPVSLAVGDELLIEMRQNHGNNGHTVGNFRWSLTSSQPAIDAPLGDPAALELLVLLKKPAADRNPDERQKIHTAFKAEAVELKALREQLASAERGLAGLEKALPRTLISKSLAKPRIVRILPRGNWQDESGETVSPALPGFMSSTWDAHNRPINRLDLAQWLVDRRNPLTARVFVNRLWRQFFGIGLSKNLDDLGAQGDTPSNPQLLDYLAVEFMDSGWDVKHMVRLIVNSRAYQQASQPTDDQLARDPENRLAGRQSRFRLPAELVRDNALAISGLLNMEIGGPSVKPYQPEGYWENLNFPQRTYVADRGPSQYRRGLYTWWQRSFVHPSMLAFDAPTREECTADRVQSNIPQQALVLLNDPTYVESARAWGVKLARMSSAAEARIMHAFAEATARQPSANETKLLRELYDRTLAEYRANETAAKDILKVGQTPPPGDLDSAELAAWTQVARAILNLHEVISRS